MTARRVAASWLARLAAQVGTDSATIWAISPEGVMHLVKNEKFMKALDESDLKTGDRLIRQHGGAAFSTGADGTYDVSIDPPGVDERGYMKPYGTPEFQAFVKRVATAWLKRAGATTFTDYIPIADPNRAFTEARQEASYSRGHGGYTGTIAEKSSFKILTRTPMAGQTLSDYIDRNMDRNEKWGPAFAVPYAEQRVVAEKEYTVQVKAKDQRAAVEMAKAAIEAKGRARKDSTVEVIIPWGAAKVVRPGGVPKVSIEPMNAQVFRLDTGGYYNNRYDSGSLKEAKEKAKQVVADMPVGQSVQIQKVLTVARITKAGEAAKLPTWEVTGTRKQVQTGKMKGWVFFGWASE